MKCDVCNSYEVIFTKRRYNTTAKWPYIWECQVCLSLVGCVNGTDQPMGKLAGAYVRGLRVELHNAFDPIWRVGLRTRSGAYALLAQHLRITAEECHISKLSEIQLRAGILFAKAYMSSKQHKIATKLSKRKNQFKRRDRENVKQKAIRNKQNFDKWD